MKRLSKTLLQILIGLSLLAMAFAGGYAYRGWQSGILLPFGLSVTTNDRPAIQHELYQQVWTLLERDYYGADPTVDQRVRASARGLAEAYADPYTYLVEPQPRELERDRLRGSFGGIGAYIDRTETGYVLRPMPDQPAEQAGILAGDRLLSIGGTSVTDETSVETITALVRGPVDTEVCLMVERQDGRGTLQTLEVCVVRAEIRTPSVEWRLLDEGAGAGSIGYIKQTLFSERSAGEMRTAIDELRDAGADRFILDLRGNPGGLVAAAVDVADLWLDSGVVFVERTADGDDTFTSLAGDVSGGAPLVVMIDGGSASASEIVSGALQDRERALLIGEQTFGKGSVQLVHELVDDSSLHVTNARWFTPDNHAIDGIGLTPDITLEPGEEALSEAISAVLSLVVEREHGPATGD